MTEEEKFQYSLSGDMGKYINEGFYPFLSEKDLRKVSSKKLQYHGTLTHLKFQTAHLQN